MPIGSMTQAMAATRALASASLPSSVRKTNGESRRGCSYGVTYPCEKEDTVRSILANAGIFPESGQ